MKNKHNKRNNSASKLPIKNKNTFAWVILGAVFFFILYLAIAATFKNTGYNSLLRQGG